MDHCMCDLHASGETIEDQPPDLSFEDRDEIGIVSQILLRAMNRRGQVAFEGTGNLQNLISTRVTHEQSCWAKDFFVEIGTYERSGVSLEYRRMRAKAFGTRWLSLSEEPYCRFSFSP